MNKSTEIYTFVHMCLFLSREEDLIWAQQCWANMRRHEKMQPKASDFKVFIIVSDYDCHKVDGKNLKW